MDWSIFLDNDLISNPGPFRPKFDYIDHKMLMPELAGFFPGIRPANLPHEEARAIERIQLITHTGTHLGAPNHFAPTMNKGERMIAIHEEPLEWYFQPGVKRHFRCFEDGMGYEATMYLRERGVRLTDTDGWSWDAPFMHTCKRYAATGSAILLWEGHKAERDIGDSHLENLQNVEALPATGFTVAYFPTNIRSGSAGSTCAFAIFEE